MPVRGTRTRFAAAAIAALTVTLALSGCNEKSNSSSRGRRPERPGGGVDQPATAPPSSADPAADAVITSNIDSGSQGRHGRHRRVGLGRPTAPSAMSPSTSTAQEAARRQLQRRQDSLDCSELLEPGTKYVVESQGRQR